MKVAKKLFYGFFVVLFSAVILVNLWLLVDQRLFGHNPPKVFGYAPLVVASGSMEPTLGIGDLILVREQEEYAKGDIITFLDSGGSLVTHRVMGEEQGTFRTKGDHNNTEDSETIAREQIVGAVTARIPGVGKVSAFLREPAGVFLLAAVGFLLIEVPIWLESRKKGARRRARADGKEKS